VEMEKFPSQAHMTTLYILIHRSRG